MLPFKTIVFATDFSPASKVAFEVAGALARDYHARIIAVHVVEPVAVGFSEAGAYVGPEEDKGEAMKRLQAHRAPSPRVTIEYRMLEGDPATVIAETAEETDADLVVMGTSGRTGLTRFVMGSVAEDVLRRAPCPVLTVRAAVEVKAAAPVEEMPETAML
ncbi:MAG: universal stress protein [Planctomycetes bacterium]|nr:universal stress protein [Planctomycetota bacterium]